MLFFWVLGGYTPQGATPTQVGFTAKGAFAFTTFYEKSLRVFCWQALFLQLLLEP
jgi:hypothetical protein